MQEDKCVEITFKYYLPEHKEDLWLTTNAMEMWSTLYEIDQRCRDIIKYGEGTDLTIEYLAEEIREMIHSKIDMNKIS